MGTKEDVAAALAANEAFYRAFAGRDFAAMDRLWAQAMEVACIHPGWTPLIGRDAVMESWAGILSNPQSPQILCTHPHATVHGELAIVVCFENVERSTLVATNLFVQERGTWRLCHHQSGPAGSYSTESRTEGDGDSTPTRLH